MPSIAGDYVACLGVSEPGAGLRRRLDQDHRAQGRRRLRHQRRQAVDHERHAGRLDVPARQYVGRRAAPEQDADLPADEDQGRLRRQEAPQDRHDVVGHRADPLRRRAGAAAQPCRRGRQGLHLPDAAVPGGAAVGGVEARCRACRTASTTRSPTRASARCSARPCSISNGVHYSLAECQTELESAARADLPRRRALRRGRGRDRRSPRWRSSRAAGSPRDDPRHLPAVLGRHGLHLGQPGVARSIATAASTSIGGGADEVMLSIICKHMGTYPRN